MHTLANVGASAAAAAMAALLGHRMQASATRPCDKGDADAGHGGAVVLFEASGSLSGVIGLVLPSETRDAVLRALLHEGEDPVGEGADSALRELGNIVASQTVSAIANVLGARILLSVPKLVVDDLGEVLRSLSGWQDRLSLESDLDGGDGSLRARLLFSIAIG